jgi:hypothetical protein
VKFSENMIEALTVLDEAKDNWAQQAGSTRPGIGTEFPANLDGRTAYALHRRGLVSFKRSQGWMGFWNDGWTLTDEGRAAVAQIKIDKEERSAAWRASVAARKQATP